jgi:hypothetical protein
MSDDHNGQIGLKAGDAATTLPVNRPRRLLVDRTRRGQHSPRGATSDSLFIPDGELHRRVAAHLGRDRFRAAIRVMESEGFPPMNSLFRGRYWPAVKAWFDNRNGGANAGAEDGQENFGDTYQ